MKCILGTLDTAKNILKYIGVKNTLSIQNHHKLHKLLPVLEEESKFYAEKYQVFLDKYATKNEDGTVKLIEGTNNVHIPDEKQEEAIRERDELYNLEVEVPDIKFAISIFGNVEINSYEFSCLIPFIEESL